MTEARQQLDQKKTEGTGGKSGQSAGGPQEDSYTPSRGGGTKKKKLTPI